MSIEAHKMYSEVLLGGDRHGGGQLLASGDVDQIGDVSVTVTVDDTNFNSVVTLPNSLKPLLQSFTFENISAVSLMKHSVSYH